MRDWLLRDLQALTTGTSERVSAPKQRRSPPDVARIISSTANTLQRRGRLGSAVMQLPTSMHDAGILSYLKTCGASDEDAASDRVSSALVIRATGPGCTKENVSHALHVIQQLWLAGSRPSSRACASVLRRCSPAQAALLLQGMSLHGPCITVHTLTVALTTLSAPACLLLSSSSATPRQSRRFACASAIQTAERDGQPVWLLETLYPYLHPHASVFAALNVADVQLPRSLALQPRDLRALNTRLLQLIVAVAPVNEVARIADNAPVSSLDSSALLSLVCRLAAENDAVRVVHLLTRPSAMPQGITRSVFNFILCKLLAGKSTNAAATVALLAGRYWTMCSARALRVLLLHLAAQPSLLHGGSFVASSFSRVADLLHLKVAPRHGVSNLKFQAKNAATELRCCVMMRDEQKSFAAAASLSSIAWMPGASPAVVLQCAKAMSCLIGSHAHDPRAMRILQELCALPALQGASAVRACALEVLSSHTAPKSLCAPPVQARVLKIQAACTLCVAKQYPLHLLASQVQAEWLQDSALSEQTSSLWLHRSLVEISETLNDDEDAVVAKLEDLLHVETEAED